MPNFRPIVQFPVTSTSRYDFSLEDCVVVALKTCHCAGHVNKKQALRKKILEAGTPSTPTKNAKWRPYLFKALWLLLAHSGYCWLSLLTWSEASAAMVSAVSQAIQYICSCWNLVITICNMRLCEICFILKVLCYISTSVGLLWKLENSWKMETKTVTPKAPYWCTELRV